MANNDTPRDRTDLELELMIDMEFLRSNPSQEVAMQYALDSLRQFARRSAREMIRRMDRRDAETVVVRHIDWP